MRVSAQPLCGSLLVDSAVFDERSLRLLMEVMGADRVMLGSDYPFPLGEHGIGNLIRHSHFSADAKAKLLAEMQKHSRSEARTQSRDQQNSKRLGCPCQLPSRRLT